MTADDLPDLPLDVPIPATSHPYRRPPVIAPTPRWAAPLYLGLAIVLVPWTVYLGLYLPGRTTGGHWSTAWTGFDAMEIVALALTAWLAYRRSTWVDIAATATGVLLVVDAWFDITTAGSGRELAQAVGSAVLLEIPLAVVSFWIARNAQVVNATVTRWLVDRSIRQSERLRARSESPDDARRGAEQEIAGLVDAAKRSGERD